MNSTVEVHRSPPLMAARMNEFNWEYMRTNYLTIDVLLVHLVLLLISKSRCYRALAPTPESRLTAHFRNLTLKLAMRARTVAKMSAHKEVRKVSGVQPRSGGIIWSRRANAGQFTSTAERTRAHDLCSTGFFLNRTTELGLTSSAEKLTRFAG